VISKEEVEKLIRSYIEKIENLGEQSGGSGHLSFTSYQLIEFDHKKINDDQVKARFTYIVVVDTEFTYYPDNPPYETEYEKKIVIDKEKNIISEETLSSKSNRDYEDMLDPTWLLDQTNILDFIEELLAKIEWQYGENRAPLKYPPEFIEEDNKFKCIVELEDDGGKLIYEADDSSSLVTKVVDDLKEKYYPQ